MQYIHWKAKFSYTADILMKTIDTYLQVIVFLVGNSIFIHALLLNTIKIRYNGLPLMIFKMKWKRKYLLWTDFFNLLKYIAYILICTRNIYPLRLYDIALHNMYYFLFQ